MVQMMANKFNVIIQMVALTSYTVSSFVLPASTKPLTYKTTLIAQQPHDTESTTTTQRNVSDSIPPPSQNGKTKMSQAIPFLECPPYLNGELAGDFGFDPLRLGKSRDNVFEMREAEIKHARLAMLAAAGWPISEMFDRKIATFFDLPPILDANDRVPSLLNGGLEKVIPEWWGFCLGLTAAIEIYGLQKARSSPLPVLEESESPTDNDNNYFGAYFPGNLGFDPFGFYPVDEKGKKRMQLCEIKHGRVAMVAVLGFSIQEAMLNQGVIDETPFFFSSPF